METDMEKGFSDSGTTAQNIFFFWRKTEPATTNKSRERSETTEPLTSPAPSSQTTEHYSIPLYAFPQAADHRGLAKTGRR